MQKTFPMEVAPYVISPPEIARLIEAVHLTRQELAAELGRHPSTLYRWESGRARPKLSDLKVLRHLAETGNRGIARPARFTFADLFAGIGGMRMGMEAAHGRCVFTCERDEYARITYQANFRDSSDHPFPKDIWDVRAEDVPQHDVLVAGFPCQPFSIAGVSKKNSLGRPHGFDDEEQGNLFFKIEELLEHHRPPAFLLENVKNLKSHDGGNTFKVIMRTVEKKLRYRVQTRIIDAAAFVPQHRERIFIVGFRDDTKFRFDDLKIPDPALGPRLATILHPEDGSEPEEPRFTQSPDAEVLPKYTLTRHLWTYLKNYAAKHRAAGNGFGYSKFGRDEIARTLSARYYKDGSEILIARGNGIPRRLTPRECSRLMGFDKPDRPFEIPVSDTRAYKQFGNAVVVPVVEAIGKHMAPYIATSIGGQQLDLPIPTIQVTSDSAIGYA